jgi:hypothetical protein
MLARVIGSCSTKVGGLGQVVAAVDLGDEADAEAGLEQDAGAVERELGGGGGLLEGEAGLAGLDCAQDAAVAQHGGGLEHERGEGDPLGALEGLERVLRLDGRRMHSARRVTDIRRGESSAGSSFAPKWY